jgi:hypothetical protein
MARALPAASGAYTLSGKSAALRKAYNLVAGTGAFVLTGQDARLMIGGLPVAVPLSTTDAGGGGRRREKKRIPIRVFLPGGRVVLAHDQAQFRAIITAAFARPAHVHGAPEGRPVPRPSAPVPAAPPEEPVVDLSDFRRAYDLAAAVGLFEAALARAEELQARDTEDEDAMATLIILAAA